MTILVTGATGTVGTQILAELAASGIPARALTRDPARARFPSGVTPARGDMLDPASFRAAVDGITTLFLLNAVTASELTEATLALHLAREAGVRHVVYLSVFNVDRFTDVPHFSAKFAIERMLDDGAVPATILRPNYYMQNEHMLKDGLRAGVYPMPIGDLGVSMVDVRDIAAVAADALVRAERADAAAPSARISLVGPDAITGTAAAATWSDALGTAVRYGGDALDPFTDRMAQHAPAWMATDMRLMLARFQRDGMAVSNADLAAMTERLGRPPRSYGDFAREAASAWRD